MMVMTVVVKFPRMTPCPVERRVSVTVKVSFVSKSTSSMIVRFTHSKRLFTGIIRFRFIAL